MLLAEDVRAQNGTLLLARGHEITETIRERLRSYKTGLVQEPIRVHVRVAESQ